MIWYFYLYMELPKKAEALRFFFYFSSEMKSLVLKSLTIPKFLYGYSKGARNILV